MTGWIISDEQHARLDRLLPATILDLKTSLHRIHPDWTAGLMAREHAHIVTAKTCLLDSVEVTNEVRFALGEAYSAIWHHREKAQTLEAVFFGKFFIDDAILRLYAASEHAAHFIVNFMNLSPEKVNNEKAEKAGFQKRVRKYLSRHHAGHPVTDAVGVWGDPSWRIVIDYRNRWIHSQPPIIAGPAIKFSRASRYVDTANGPVVIGKTGGDPPDFKLDEILDHATKSYCLLLDLLGTFEPMLLRALEAQNFQFLENRIVGPSNP